MEYEKQDVEKYLDKSLDDILHLKVKWYDGSGLMFTKKFLNKVKRFIKREMWNADFQLKIYWVSTGQIFVLFEQKEVVKFDLWFMNDQENDKNGVQWQCGDTPRDATDIQEGFLSNPLDVQRLLKDFYKQMES
jgi:hypothetical protein